MGATTVKFEFNVARHEDLYGFTLRVRDHEEGQEEQEDEECTSYHLVFKGPKEGDLSEICDKFMACHQEVRESIGLVQRVSPDEFEEKMDTSIELAGDLMSRHGFKVEETENVAEDILEALFSDDDDDCPDMDEPVVLFRVNNYEFNKPDPRWRLNLEYERRAPGFRRGPIRLSLPAANPDRGLRGDGGLDARRRVGLSDRLGLALPHRLDDDLLLGLPTLRSRDSDLGALNDVDGLLDHRRRLGSLPERLGRESLDRRGGWTARSEGERSGDEAGNEEEERADAEGLDFVRVDHLGCSLLRQGTQDLQPLEDPGPSSVEGDMKATVLVLDASCGPDWRYCDSNRHTNDCWREEETDITQESLKYLGSRGINGSRYGVFERPDGRIVATEGSFV